jgi:hypothetical protein
VAKTSVPFEVDELEPEREPRVVPWRQDLAPYRTSNVHETETRLHVCLVLEQVVQVLARHSLNCNYEFSTVSITKSRR